MALWLLITVLATALADSDSPPQHELYFVMNFFARTADGGAAAGQGQTVLGALFDTNVAAFIPGTDTSAVKVHSTTEAMAILGDLDADGDFWELHWGDIDALGLRRFAAIPSAMTTGHFVFSTQEHWGGAMTGWLSDAGGARAGSLFSLRRQPGGTDYRVEFFLREWLILDALGHLGGLDDGNGVDVDAFTQDSSGNVFLSFRHTELVNGVPLDPAGVVCLPAGKLSYDTAGNVVAVYSHGAVIVLDRARVDACVVSAGLTTASGLPITSVGNLQALSIDPHGNGFAPVHTVPGLGPLAPALLFNGSELGATVLSTADGGRIARLNGQLLGAVPISGTVLGLDAATTSKSHDLNGLMVRDIGVRQICVDVTDAEVDLTTADRVEFVVGNLSPLSPVLLFFRLGPTQPGADAGSQLAWPAWSYPDVFVAPFHRVLGVVSDGRGRVFQAFDPVTPPGLAVWVLCQAFDVERQQLSAPAALWCPGP
jgi:hypothetical protein